MVDFGVMSTASEHIRPETLTMIEDRAMSLGLSVDEYLRRLLPGDVKELGLNGDDANREFEEDMVEFAEGTENRTPGKEPRSRDDIYFDHD